MNKQVTAIAMAISIMEASMGFAADKPAPVEALTDYSAKETRNVEKDLATRQEAKIIAKPTKQQLAFQDLELGLFIHFGLPTYTGKSAGDGPSKDPATLFNPKKLDCEQWMEVAKSMGATYVMLTARHESGFCIWPTETTEYSVKSRPFGRRERATQPSPASATAGRLRTDNEEAKHQSSSGAC